jgi:hypothetical protein
MIGISDVDVQIGFTPSGFGKISKSPFTPLLVT